MESNSIFPVGPTRKNIKSLGLDNLQEWIPVEHRWHLNVVIAWKIIAKHYCAALVTRGVCPIECEKCRPVVVEMFDLDDAENPAALLCWRAKDRSAKEIERLITLQCIAENLPALESPDPYHSLFPDRSPEQNIFLELMNQYAEDLSNQPE